MHKVMKCKSLKQFMNVTKIQNEYELVNLLIMGYFYDKKISKELDKASSILSGALEFFD